MNEYTLQEHARDIAALLASEWLAEGPVRAWHASYAFANQVYALSLVQRRGVAGFQVAAVSPFATEQLQSGAAVTVAAACVWLGLANVPHALDWHIEL